MSYATALSVALVAGAKRMLVLEGASRGWLTGRLVVVIDGIRIEFTSAEGASISRLVSWEDLAASTVPSVTLDRRIVQAHTEIMGGEL